MRSHPKSKLTLVLLLVAALFALPAAAHASLAFVKGSLQPSVYVAADNGKGAHKISGGRSPESLRTGSRSSISTKAPATRRK